MRSHAVIELYCLNTGILPVAHTAADLGGTVINYMQASALTKTNGRISGVVARDLETNRESELSARVVINATGVFADRVRQMDQPDASRMVAPSQGAHIVLDRSF